MTARHDRICRDVRRELVAALLEVAGRDDLPGRLADHVGACRDCAAYRDRLLATVRALPAGPVYHPRLRSRTLAAVADDRDHAWPALWLWLPPAAAACAAMAYGLPAWVVAGTFETALGSPGLGLAAALPLVGSLLVLLPAALAVVLLRSDPEPNDATPSEPKGVLR